MPTTLKDVPGFPPHGGALELRMASDDEIGGLKAKISELPTIEARSRRVLSDLELFAVGAVSPNRGFMKKDDYTSVVNEMRLANGLPWSLPITLAPTEDELANLKEGSQAAITHEGTPVAIVEVEEIFDYDAADEAEKC